MQMHKKIISVLLVIVLMFTSFTFTSTAEETLPELQSSLDSVDYTENSAEELVLPDIIEQNDVQAAEKYEARAQSFETSLNMFVFRNNDGTYTKKIYSHPVKYIDDTGAVRDITTDIEKLSDGTFRTADNDVVTTFSRMLSDGITLSYDDISVKMIPVINSSSASTGNISASDNASLVSSLSSDNKTVSYPYGNKA